MGPSFYSARIVGSPAVCRQVARRFRQKTASGKLLPTSADFASVFAELKPVLARYADDLAVKTDTAIEYTLVSGRCARARRTSKSASPFKQHKGQAL